MSWTTLRLSLLTLGALIASISQAAAASVTAVSTVRFGYEGSYTKYATEADALAGVNSIGSGLIERPGDPGPSTDMYLDFWSGAGSAPNESSIGASWWYTTASDGKDGRGNPFQQQP